LPFVLKVVLGISSSFIPTKLESLWEEIAGNLVLVLVDNGATQFHTKLVERLGLPLAPTVPERVKVGGGQRIKTSCA